MVNHIDMKIAACILAFVFCSFVDAQELKTISPKLIAYLQDIKPGDRVIREHKHIIYIYDNCLGIPSNLTMNFIRDRNGSEYLINDSIFNNPKREYIIDGETKYTDERVEYLVGPIDTASAYIMIFYSSFFHIDDHLFPISLFSNFKSLAYKDENEVLVHKPASEE